MTSDRNIAPLGANLPQRLGRLVLTERMGQGTSASVFRAFDEVRGEDVAVKILLDRRLPVADLKKEFRRAVGITHPNVVFPLDLLEEGGFVCLTMRLVEGRDFLSAVRPEGQLDEALLRSTLSDIACGVEALHGFNLVHGDIKPSNVIITPEGRAVVVDLGHARSARDAPDDRHGAWAYAAPEVIRDGVGSEAGDWYGVGVMLLEALTGKRPFSPEMALMYLEKQAGPSLPSDGPADLLGLATALLCPRPDERANVRHILALLAPADGVPSTTRQAVAETPFVDRRDELRTMLDAIEQVKGGIPAVIHLTGPSGVGKSRLVRKLQADFDGRGDLRVLTGHCYPRDYLPLRAMDDCVEQLAHELTRERLDWSDSCTLDERLACAQLFPALAASPASEAPTPAGSDVASVRERRSWGFRALGRAFAALASTCTVIVVLDDLQWGDELSARALSEVLVGVQGSQVAFVLVYRDEDTKSERTFLSDFLSWERSEMAYAPILIPLAPLPNAEATKLAEALSSSHAVAAEVAQAAHGMPFLIELLARSRADSDAIGLSPEAALERELGYLGAASRELLEIVCLVDGPLGRGELAQILGLDMIEAETLLAQLETRRLIRTTGPEQRLSQPYHDTIRGAVIAALPDERARSLHRRLAAHALAKATPDKASAAIHARAAGDLGQALELAHGAALEASQGLAFEDALRLYRLALECEAGHSEKRPALLEGAARAAAALGRNREAATLLLQALALQDGSNTSDELRERAGAFLLQAGLVEDGLAVTKDLRKRLGIRIPTSDFGTKLALMVAYLRLDSRSKRYHRQPPVASDAPLPLRTRSLFELGRGLISFDGNRGSVLVLQATREALVIGNRPVAAYGLIYLGAMLTYDGRKKPVASGLAFIERGRALADQSGDRRTQLFAQVASAMAEFCQGHHTRALVGFDKAIDEIAQTCPEAAWERMVCETSGLYALQQQGELGVLADRVTRMRLRAEDAGDLALMVETDIFTAAAHLARDLPERVGPSISAAIAQWTVTGFSSQHWHALRLTALHDLYVGAEPAHLTAFLAGIKQAKGAGLLGIQMVRVEANATEARLRLSLAERGKAKLEARAIRSNIKQMRKDGPVYALGRAAAAEAGLLALEGDRSGAARMLAEASTHLQVATLSLERAACLARLALLAGTSTPAEVTATMAAARIAKPDAWLRALVPGIS